MDETEDQIACKIAEIRAAAEPREKPERKAPNLPDRIYQGKTTSKVVQRRRPKIDLSNIYILDLLHWAFARECASIELPSAEIYNMHRRSVGIEYVLMERAKLGAKIDESRGTSDPHDDAEAVAACVQNIPAQLGGFKAAVTLAELARINSTPDYMPGAVPKWEPLRWAKNVPKGRTGKAEVFERVYLERKIPHPKNPAKTVTRRKMFDVMWVPCRQSPTRGEIACAREKYLQWWETVDYVRFALTNSGTLREAKLTHHMPPKRPWATHDRIVTHHIDKCAVS